MAISFKKYIDITSGVGGATLVNRRDLIGRLFTTNNLLPPNSFIEFTSAEQVGVYFGLASEEYLRAVQYFAFISKNITRPQRISFARWVDADVTPFIFGSKFTTTLAQFQAITDGSFTLNISPDSNVISGLDFSLALSLADVASIIETAINAEVGVMWTAATVTYNALSGGFDFVGGSAVAATISAGPGGVGTELLALIGWVAPFAIFADGALTETVTETLTNSANASDNFGSFLFMQTMTIDEIVEAAEWNDLQNFKFMYTVPVLKVDAQSYYDDLKDIGGVGVTISETSGEYPEQDPMVILAATNYSAANSVQNYMFQIFPQTPSVTTTAESDAFDLIRTNYYGRTQTAGQFLDFYQRGVLMGIATDALDMNTYANEVWLKDAAGAAIMNLLLAVARLSANAQGKIQLMTVLQGIVDEALNNGTISVGKTLNTTQKLFIADKSNDSNAWYQVQNIGYWLNVFIDASENKAVYTLIYSKDDAIRKVEGSHVLI